MPKTWDVRKIEGELAALPELPEIILKLLALRGLRSSEEINAFLNPNYANLSEPFLFRDMQKAVDRIRAAIASKEKIIIYADYDADAITACAVMYLGLTHLGANVGHYIPDRFAEGYGMNPEAVRQLAADGAKLIITVDCGINATAEAEVCRELGVDLVITDHHELTDRLPEAFAVINPKNPSDNYPFPYLTGVGVAFKVIQALITDGWEKWLLDLVAIGTVADIQSLSGENRILVNFGLRVIGKTRWTGLAELIRLAGIKNKIDAYTLGFMIAPRINAAGRLKHGNLALELLITEDPARAKALAQEIDLLNQKRQQLTEQVLSEARGQAQMMTDKKIMLVSGHDWPKGVVGLVAGKLAEEFNRPVLAVSLDPDGSATGSARSAGTFDIVAALTHAKETLVKYGGHTMAGGFSLKSENLSDFHLRLIEYAESVDYALAEPALVADLEITGDQLTWEIWEFLEKFEPFGEGNPRPKFLGKKLEIVSLRTVGTKQQHLKLTLSFGPHRLGAIAFGRGRLAAELQVGQNIDAIFELSVNEWNGNRELELKVIDLKHD